VRTLYFIDRRGEPMGLWQNLRLIYGCVTRQSRLSDLEQQWFLWHCNLAWVILSVILFLCWSSCYVRSSVGLHWARRLGETMFQILTLHEVSGVPKGKRCQSPWHLWLVLVNVTSMHCPVCGCYKNSPYSSSKKHIRGECSVCFLGSHLCS
jgi:hypothetical protein